MLSDNDDDESAIKKSGQVLTNWISGSVVMYERRGKRDVVLLAGHFTIQAIYCVSSGTESSRNISKTNKTKDFT